MLCPTSALNHVPWHTLRRLHSTTADLKEAEAALPWQTANERTLEEKALRAEAAESGDHGYTGKYFVCHGTGPNVPKFLRFSGKVRNRMISKHDTEVFIKSFWEARVKAISSEEERRRKKAAASDREEVALEDGAVAERRKVELKLPQAFLNDFMKSRFGLQVIHRCRLLLQIAIAGGAHTFGVGVQATVAEFGYNLVDALNRYAGDASPILLPAHH